MPYFKEDIIIKELSDMDLAKLKNISTIHKKNSKDGKLFFHFELYYKNHKGFITARYNETTKEYENVSLSLNFGKTPMLNDFKELKFLANKFLKLLDNI